MGRLPVILASAAISALAHAADEPALVHNPFARPDVAATVSPSGAVSGGWPEELRATLVDGKQSLANLDGTLVTVGETVGGATVMHIGEGVVTLVRGKTSHVMKLNEDTTPTRRRARRE